MTMTDARTPSRSPAAGPTHGLARVLSKLGYCSRKAAEGLVRDGRVTVDGRRITDPESRTDPRSVRIAVDGKTVGAASARYLMLNKPRGLVTTASDPQGRGTVFDCLPREDATHLAPVGRLDKASEGLLLFTNDTIWANDILDGPAAPLKTYHVKIDRAGDAELFASLVEGVVDSGERLAASSVSLLRQSDKSAWLEIVLSEGRNRHIRRLLSAHGIETLRLVRVAIGPLQLGDLPKGATRALAIGEIEALGRAGTSLRNPIPATGSDTQNTASKVDHPVPTSGT